MTPALNLRRKTVPAVFTTMATLHGFSSIFETFLEQTASKNHVITYLGYLHTSREQCAYNNRNITNICLISRQISSVFCIVMSSSKFI